MGDKIYELEKNLLNYQDDFQKNTNDFDVEYKIKNELDKEYQEEIQNSTLQSLKFLLAKEEKAFYERREILINLIKETEKTTRSNTEKIEEHPYSNTDSLVKFKYCPEYFYFKFPELSSVQQEKKQIADNFLDRFIAIEIEKTIENYQHEYGYFKLLNEYTIVFVHHYTNKKAGIKDTDNFNIKKPIDAINGRLLKNDTVKSSHICQFTIEDLSDYTEMFVFPGHKIQEIVMENLPPLDAR